MLTQKTFTFAGTSVLNGQLKLRFANDAARTIVLVKNKHEDVKLVQLSVACNKLQAAQALQKHALFADAATQQLIADYIAQNSALLASNIVAQVPDAATQQDDAATQQSDDATQSKRKQKTVA